MSDNERTWMGRILMGVVLLMLGWMYDMNGKIGDVLDTKEKTRKQWTRTNWLKDELTRLGHQHDFEVKSWPEGHD